MTETPPISFFEAAARDSSAGPPRLAIEEPGFDFHLLRDGSLTFRREPNTHFGFIYRGDATLRVEGRPYPLCEGMYFAAVGDARLDATGVAIVASQKGHTGLFSLGGPIEQEGRLHYIDGCSDTLLLPPVVMGDACLNFLRIPPHTNQTSHTHPSFRFGIVAAGAGWCDSPAGSEELREGKVFYIPPDGVHRFRTEEDSLSVIAFHPDSDFGPEDDNHPMVNKTIVNGVSAAKLSHEQRGLAKQEDGR